MAANATYYTFFGFADTVEERTCFLTPVDGTLSNFVAKQNATMSVGSVVEVTVRVNQQETALCLQFTSVDGTNVKTNTTEVSVSKGDIISLRMKKTAGVFTRWS